MHLPTLLSFINIYGSDTKKVKRKLLSICHAFQRRQNFVSFKSGVFGTRMPKQKFRFNKLLKYAHCPLNECSRHTRTYF